MKLHTEKSSLLLCTALFLAVAVVCAGNQAAAQTTINLGAAESFAVLGGTTVTNTGSTVLFGDLGVSPGTSITGFPPGTVTGGSIHLNDSIAIQAQADALTAYNQLAGLGFATDLTGQDLGGLTLTPGVYSYSAAAGLTGTLTLNGLNQADTLFVFQIGSTLTTASSAAFNFINGATASNVWFQVGSSATLGSDTAFAGTIIALASDTLTTGVSVDGRIIALNGAVTLECNQISVAAIPEPATTALILSALAAVVVLGARRFRLFL